ncbi:MAG TPA: hypothetical protein VEW95_04335 [Candidatus Limnocylindrales bacterium]|nr:hypothetical protein [Candidatus Limnocylindrales bacterium]
MRQRLRPFRDRMMARRPGDDDSLPLSPRARRIAGWVAAALLIGGIALAFRLLGGNGDGTEVDPSPSGSGGASTQTVMFGTALDAATGQVAADTETSRFADGDLFVYSVPPAGVIPDPVFVEVRRTGGGTVETVQAPVGAQPLPDPTVIAFTVPTALLLADFGPGEYLMLIYDAPTGDPIAEGSFELVAAPASPAVSSSSSPSSSP